MYNVVSSIIGIVGALGFVGYLVHLGIHGDPERQREIDDREFFRRHGHWPGEPPEPEDP